MINKFIGDLLDELIPKYKTCHPKLSEKELIRLILDDMCNQEKISKIALDEYSVKYDFKQPIIKEAA